MRKELVKNEKFKSNIMVLFCISICFTLALIFIEINNIKNGLPDIFNVSVHHIEKKSSDLPEIQFTLNSGTEKTYNNKNIQVYFNCYNSNGIKADGHFYVNITLNEDINSYNFTETLIGSGSYDKNIEYCEFNYAIVRD